MNPTVRLYVRDIVGQNYAVDQRDGERVYSRIVESLHTAHRVEISFDRVELTIPAFLNVAIGQLLSEFPAGELRDRVSFVDLTAEDRALLRLVVDNAKKYFRERAAGTPPKR